MRRQYLMLFALALSLHLLTPGIGHAADDRFTLFAAQELTFADPGNTQRHGIAILAWDRTGLANDARLHLSLNTDTLTLEYADHRLSDRWTIGAFARGEIYFGNLLPDFFVNGEKIEEYGVTASFVDLGVRAKYSPADHHFLTLSFRVNPWFIGRKGDLTGSSTDEDLVIPDPIVLLRPAIDYTYWNPGNDPSNWQVFRPFPRVDGVAFGVNLGLDIRPNAERWGYLDAPDRFDPVLQRNDPSHVAWFSRAWLRWGTTPGELLRLQGSARLGWGDGGDDVTRVQIGGINAYPVRIPGLPWGAFMNERYAQTDAELRFRLPSEHELGFGGTIAAVNDPARISDEDRWEPIPAAHLLADLRFGEWQLDIRGAIGSGARWSTTGPHYGVYLSLGREWSLGKE